MVIAYDFTVLAGTQGHLNHRKKDRMFEMARNFRLPLVLFAEGGGGRPGDTDGDFSSRTFHDFATLSGLVPLVGIVSGRCFAGNASLLGCCDVIIATRNTNIGMGGPAMIESGGLGVVSSRRGRSDGACRCPTAWSISRSPTKPKRSRWRSSICPTSKARSRLGNARSEIAARDHPREPAARL